jgi:hypothetical protein
VCEIVVTTTAVSLLSRDRERECAHAEASSCKGPATATQDQVTPGLVNQHTLRAGSSSSRAQSKPLGVRANTTAG